MKRPHKYTGTFTFAKKNIVFNFWSVAADTPPDTVIFLGAGQVGSITRWVAQAAGEGVVAVDGLPHWEAHPSGEDTAAFTTAYVQTAHEHILKTFRVPAMHLMAESQAAPGVVILARNTPDKVRNLALIKPLGFSAQALGESDKIRMRTFRRRFLKSALQFSQSLLHDVRNAGIALTMIRMTLREPSLASFNKKYAIGVSYDLLEDCREVAKIQQRKHDSFTLILGERDRLFPPKEIFAAMAAASIEGISIEVVPRVGHASLAVKASRTTLERALQAVRKRQTGQDL